MSAFLAPPFGMHKTDLYHLLDQTAPILDSWWHMFIISKPEDYRLPLEIASNYRYPRHSFQTGHPNPNTMLLQKIIHLSSCAIVRLINIRPKINPNPKAMLSMIYPETHPITRSTKNSKEG
jgi:hypothetical protein